MLKLSIRAILQGNGYSIPAKKYFENAQIKDSTLTTQFQTGKVKIQLPTYAPNLLQEIKDFIE